MPLTLRWWCVDFLLIFLVLTSTKPLWNSGGSDWNQSWCWFWCHKIPWFWFLLEVRGDWFESPLWKFRESGWFLFKIWSFTSGFKLLFFWSFSVRDGLDSWNPLMKGIGILRCTNRIPNHRDPNQQLTISWRDQIPHVFFWLFPSGYLESPR